MSDDLLKYLSAKLKDEQDVITSDLSMGKAKDFGEYKFACGIMRGLLIANNLIVEISERMDTSDD